MFGFHTFYHKKKLIIKHLYFFVNDIMQNIFYCVVIEDEKFVLYDNSKCKTPLAILKPGLHDTKVHLSASLFYPMSLGWEMLPHSPFSPDITPSDYQLVRLLQHFLSGISKMEFPIFLIKIHLCSTDPELKICILSGKR